MKTSMVDLAQWIDVLSGDITADLRRRDEKTLIEEVHLLGVEKLLDGKLLQSPSPYALVHSELRIKLSEEIKEDTAKVYPGVSCIREAFDDYREIDYPAYTRERPREHRFVLLGEFKAQGKNGTIYLYTKAIATCDHAVKLGFKNVFWATLAHNTFYAFLYNQMKREGMANRWRSGAKRDRETVKASLAAYFEGAFLGFPPISGYLENEWESLDIEGWPSSGAFMIRKSSRPEKLFRQLYNMAFYDWKTAADILRTGYYLNNSIIHGAVW